MNTINRDSLFSSYVSEEMQLSLENDENMVNLELSSYSTILADSDNISLKSRISSANDISFGGSEVNLSVLPETFEANSFSTGDVTNTSSFSYKGSSKIRMAGRILIKPKNNQSTSIIERFGCVCK